MAHDLARTRIIGHLSLADVYAKEFLSDVTDCAVVRHASISVVVLQTAVKSIQVLPDSIADDGTACDSWKSGLTGLGVVFHVGWLLVFSMFWCVASDVYLQP